LFKIKILNEKIVFECEQMLFAIHLRYKKILNVEKKIKVKVPSLQKIIVIKFKRLDLVFQNKKIC